MADIRDIRVTVDVLNEEHFLDVMQRAIDLCAISERVVGQIRNRSVPDADALEYAAANFREFFEGVDEE